MQECEPTEARWLRVIHILAKGAAELGYRFSPKRGCEVLQAYLPLALEKSWLFETWFLRDMAEYLSMTNSRGSALEISQRVFMRASDLGEVDRNVHFSHALVLLNTGQGQNALQLLESVPKLDWNSEVGLAQQVYEATIWVRVLRGANRCAEADLWMDRLASLVRENNLWQIQNFVQPLYRGFGGR